MHLCRLRPHLEAADLNALAYPSEDSNTHRWCKQGKAHGIGKKTWRQQKRAGNQNHGTMRQRLAGILELRKAATQVVYGTRTLLFDHPSAENSRQNNDQQSRPQTDKAPDLNEQTDLDQRDQKKGQKQPHR